jgi:hypothetical protein
MLNIGTQTDKAGTPSRAAQTVTRRFHPLTPRSLHIGFLHGLILLLLVFSTPWALSQTIESVMAPGKLAKAHAKYEEDCSQCHVKFDRQAQDKRCLDCHKETRADVLAHTGYHGKMKPQACRECHTEHKGLDALIVTLDKKEFDHKISDYPLNGKHQKVECEKCHVAGKKYREAPATCIACHKKDDKHKGTLGDKCADCHDDASWKEAKFDHSKTKFALTGKHVDTKCVDCHLKGVYKDTPKTCIACHKKDDEQKGHKGQYGEKCETCHGAKLWKETTFNHDHDTKYVLNGKHRVIKCTACHTGNLYKVKTSQECIACHVKDDKHKESLGRECAKCHNEKSWKESPKFDHAKTSFPLLGKHVKVECKLCHEGAMYKQASKECVACHKKNDKHISTLGDKCADCHTDRDWKATLFDHDKTKFRLKNAHKDAKVKCEACHKDLKSYRNTLMDCVACHKKDDKHEGQVGPKCESCHTDINWKVERFDHNRTRYALTGRHVLATCKSCHETSRYRDARRDCVGCHIKDDKHKKVYGARCETCHNTRSWPLWDYDHDVRTHYRLDGAHRTVACASCHREPAPVGKNAAPLGTNCYACHRSSDVHEGKFGPRCEQCHMTQTWKKIRG